MRLRPFLLLLLSALLLTGCGGDAQDEPDTGADPKAAVEQVLRDHLVAADAGDCAAVKETVVVPEDVECAEVRGQKGGWSSDGTDLASVPMTVEIVEGSATVTVAWESGDDMWPLEKTDDGWRVLNVDAADGV